MTEQDIKRRIRCTAFTSKGTPCRSWAIRGTDPPRCVAHGGGSGKHGAPLGNKNALKHGYYAGKSSAELTAGEVFSRGLLTNYPDLEESPNVNENPQVKSPSGNLKQKMNRVVDDLYSRHLDLSAYIDKNKEYMTLREYSHLLTLHAQMASRLSRLLRDQAAVIAAYPARVEKVIRMANKTVDKILRVEKGNVSENVPDDDEHQT